MIEENTNLESFHHNNNNNNNNNDAIRNEENKQNSRNNNCCLNGFHNNNDDRKRVKIDFKKKNKLLNHENMIVANTQESIKELNSEIEKEFARFEGLFFFFFWFFF